MPRRTNARCWWAVVLLLTASEALAQLCPSPFFNATQAASAASCKPKPAKRNIPLVMPAPTFYELRKLVSTLAGWAKTASRLHHSSALIAKHLLWNGIADARMAGVQAFMYMSANPCRMACMYVSLALLLTLCMYIAIIIARGRTAATANLTAVAATPGLQLARQKNGTSTSYCDDLSRQQLLQLVPIVMQIISSCRSALPMSQLAVLVHSRAKRVVAPTRPGAAAVEAGLAKLLSAALLAEQQPELGDVAFNAVVLGPLGLIVVDSAENMQQQQQHHGAPAMPADAISVLQCASVLMRILEEQDWDGVGEMKLPDDMMHELCCATAAKDGLQEFDFSTFKRALQLCRALY